jgi:hypothetical protein
MSVDDGSLPHSDVKALIERVKSSNLAWDDSSRPGNPERGDLRQFRTEEREVKESAARNHLFENRAGVRKIEDEDGGNVMDEPEEERRKKGSL